MAHPGGGLRLGDNANSCLFFRSAVDLNSKQNINSEVEVALGDLENKMQEEYGTHYSTQYMAYTGNWVSDSNKVYYKGNGYYTVNVLKHMSEQEALKDYMTFDRSLMHKTTEHYLDK